MSELQILARTHPRAAIGYDLGILSPRIFAMLVVMALVTTLLTLFRDREAAIDSPPARS